MTSSIVSLLTLYLPLIITRSFAVEYSKCLTNQLELLQKSSLSWNLHRNRATKRWMRWFDPRKRLSSVGRLCIKEEVFVDFSISIYDIELIWGIENTETIHVIVITWKVLVSFLRSLLYHTCSINRWRRQVTRSNLNLS